MVDTELEAFDRLLTGLADAYGRDLSPMARSLYWGCLKRYELQALVNAAQQHLSDPKSGKFMPKPADFVLLLDGLPDDRAAMAWSRAWKAVECYGRTRSVVFEDGLTGQVIDGMGGWLAFCDCKDADVPFRQREFCQRYAALMAAGHTGEEPYRLAGRYELDNNARGYGQFVDPPALVRIRPGTTHPVALPEPPKPLMLRPRNVFSIGGGNA